MAGSIGSLSGSWNPAIDVTPPSVLLKRAMDGEQTFVNRVVGEPDFVITGRLTDDAEVFTVIDLTARGVTFPAGTQRALELELFVSGATTATESGYIRRFEMIVGGTTPVVGIGAGGTTNMAGAVGGFTTADPILAATMATNNVTITVTNESEAEINNFRLHVWVGRLVTIPAGV